MMLQPSVSKTVPGEGGDLHIRLCHHCNNVNEGEEPVGQCTRCGKHLSFYSLLEDLSDDEAEESWLDEFDAGDDEDEANLSLYDPEDEPILQGLSVLW